MTRILSGIQPTGEIHLGNQLGALRHWVAQQEQAECLYLLADLHAITVPQDPAALREQTLATAALLLAIGIDPRRSALFVQSHVAPHAELAWVLSCVTGFGELSRMTQFKDQTARHEPGGVTVGLFAYPVLQAADILLYRADAVPVGEDQVQHLELTRDVAERFNRRFGATFTVPKALVTPVGARIMDLQDPRRKMSKSAQSPLGTIRLTDSPHEIRAKLKAAVTDSGREVRARPDKPAISNLLTIYAVLSGRDVSAVEAEFAGQGYAAFKAALAETLIASLAPVRERYVSIRAEPEEITRVLREGADKARAIASETMSLVYPRIGLLPR